MVNPSRRQTDTSNGKEADGECGAQAPEQPLRLRDRNGEKERAGSESGTRTRYT